MGGTAKFNTVYTGSTVTSTTYNNAAYADTGCTVSNVVCTGRPVDLWLSNDRSGNPGFMEYQTGVSALLIFLFRVRRDSGTVIDEGEWMHQLEVSVLQQLRIPPWVFKWVDKDPAPGTHSYQLQVFTNSTNLLFTRLALNACEK